MLPLHRAALLDTQLKKGSRNISLGQLSCPGEREKTGATPGKEGRHGTCSFGRVREAGPRDQR